VSTLVPGTRQYNDLRPVWAQEAWFHCHKWQISSGMPISWHFSARFYHFAAFAAGKILNFCTDIKHETHFNTHRILIFTQLQTFFIFFSKLYCVSKEEIRKLQKQGKSQ
jgi:hypothetical protein